jgi:hypothetical protein
MMDNVKLDFKVVWLWMRLTESSPLADFDIDISEPWDSGDTQTISNCCVLAVIYKLYACFYFAVALLSNYLSHNAP